MSYDVETTEEEFEETMNLRQIEKYISENYEIYNSIH